MIRPKQFQAIINKLNFILGFRGKDYKITPSQIEFPTIHLSYSTALRLIDLIQSSNKSGVGYDSPQLFIRIHQLAAVYIILCYIKHSVFIYFPHITQISDIVIILLSLLSIGFHSIYV